MPAPLTPGTHILTASYSGSPSFLSSESASRTVTIGPAPTQLDVSADDAPITDGVVLKIFAYGVTLVPDVPTGTLLITERGSVLAQQAISGNVSVKLQLAAGHHTLSIAYSGDDKFQPSMASFDVDVQGLPAHGTAARALMT